MNMLSAQVDRLRELATRCNELQVGATRVVRVPLYMGSILSEAADTICELRDCLLCANEAVQDAEHDESMAWDRVRKAEAESEKLRELLAELYEDQCDECDCWKYRDRMRNLGVEVDA